jgi:hypothetical protein
MQGVLSLVVRTSKLLAKVMVILQLHSKYQY